MLKDKQKTLRMEH